MGVGPREVKRPAPSGPIGPLPSPHIALGESVAFYGHTKPPLMKFFAQIITVVSLIGLTLAVLGNLSSTLILAIAAIFAADFIAVLIADFRRTQRRRIVAGFNAVAARTHEALRFAF